jgi:CubicO group peptidase (beta-lactamase class C family)
MPMQFIVKVLKWLAVLVAVAVIGGFGWLYVFPPDLFRVGSGYAAKIVCSNVFIAGRDPQQVLEVDVQAPGHPLLRLMRVDVNREAGTVTAGLLGLFGSSVALHRPGLGCTSVPDGDLDNVQAIPVRESGKPADPTVLWPEGSRVEASQNPALEAALADDALAGPGMRAVVVVQNGHIVAERYGEGFSAGTPLLGWSMTKTVNAALIGGLVRDGRLDLSRRQLFPSWTDERGDISMADLMAMSSGLSFNEDYGDVTDVTRMLYLRTDMAAFAADKPLAAAPGTQFNYSSGTAAILSRLWQNAFSDPVDAWNWPRLALFDRIGMRSAVLEADAAGTFAGSSYLYATARDWARFGQLLLNRGGWAGSRVLDPEFVDMMTTPAATDEGYGQGQLWLHGPGREQGFDIPADDFWLIGHDGQTMAVIPSRGLVVLRMGLTPPKLDYRPQRLVEAVLRALP